MSLVNPSGRSLSVQSHLSVVRQSQYRQRSVRSVVQQTQYDVVGGRYCDQHLRFSIPRKGVDQFDLNEGLVSACEQGDVSIVQRLYQEVVFPDCIDINGNSALHIAARFGHIHFVSWLLDQHDDIHWINTENNDGETPLILAARAGHRDVIACLIENNADLDRFHAGFQTALFEACHQGHGESACSLIEAGASLKDPYENKCSILPEACEHALTDVVTELERHGVDITREATFSHSVLSGDVVFLNWMIDTYYPELKDPSSTAHHYVSYKNAVKSGNVDMCTYIKSLPGSSYNGDFLSIACEGGSSEMISYCLEDLLQNEDVHRPTARVVNIFLKSQIINTQKGNLEGMHQLNDVVPFATLMTYPNFIQNCWDEAMRNGHLHIGAYLASQGMEPPVQSLGSFSDLIKDHEESDLISLFTTLFSETEFSLVQITEILATVLEKGYNDLFEFLESRIQTQDSVKEQRLINYLILKNGNVHFLKRQLDRNDIYLNQPFGRHKLNTPLFVATRFGQLDCVKTLVEEGADTGLFLDCNRLIQKASVGSGSLDMIRYWDQMGFPLDDGPHSEVSQFEGNKRDLLSLLEPRSDVDKTEILKCFVSNRAWDKVITMLMSYPCLRIESETCQGLLSHSVAKGAPLSVIKLFEKKWGSVSRLRLSRSGTCVDNKASVFHVMKGYFGGDSPYRLSVLVYLLRQGCSANRRGNSDPDYPLHLAVQNNSTRIVRLLLDNGYVDQVHQSLKNRQGKSPYDYARESGNHEMIDYFSEKGLSEHDAEYLRFLMKNHMYSDVISTLEDEDRYQIRDLNEALVDGSTLFRRAVQSGQEDVALAIVSHSTFNPSTAFQNASHDPLLTMCFEYRQFKLFDTLLDRHDVGSFIDQADKNGRTALMVLTKHACIDGVRHLLLKGASVSHRDKQSMTARMIAIEEGFYSVSRVLREAGSYSR